MLTTPGNLLLFQLLGEGVGFLLFLAMGWFCLGCAHFLLVTVPHRALNTLKAAVEVFTGSAAVVLLGRLKYRVNREEHGSK